MRAELGETAMDSDSQRDWLGYGRQSIEERDVEAVVEVLRSGALTGGPAVGRFERGLEACTGAPHAVGVTNGSAALHLALAALGIGPGQRVLTSANTFLASATAALHCGAEVDFVDIEPRTRNLDLDQLERACAAGRVDAVVAVHFAGLPCDMQRLLELAQRFGFHLIEDACHALGASYRVDGRTWRVGEHPGVAATALSFHPVKAITTAEGGALLVHDDELAARLGRLRDHGLDRATRRAPFEDSAGGAPWFASMEELGWNLRLSDLHAALGSSQLERLQAFLERRRALAARYSAELRGYGLPAGDPGHAWHLYVIGVEARRDELMAFLRERGIGTQLHYYPVPLQPYFRQRLGRKSYPSAEGHARTGLSLPLFPAMTDADQDRVLAALEQWRQRP